LVGGGRVILPIFSKYFMIIFNWFRYILNYGL
jgi:hypothetical protein